MYTSNAPGTTPCVCATVKKLSRVLVKLYDASLSEAGINITQLDVLRCIGRREGDNLSNIATELEMERTSCYRAIAPMERDGWITVRAGSTARMKTALVTPKGKRILAKADAGWSAMQEHIFSSFGEARWLQLVNDFDELAETALS